MQVSFTVELFKLWLRSHGSKAQGGEMNRGDRVDTSRSGVVKMEMNDWCA